MIAGLEGLDSKAVIDTFFQYISSHLLAQNFDSCDSLLRRIDLKQCDAEVILAALSLTREVKEKLPYRAEFLKHARARLAELDPTRVHRIQEPE